MSLKPVRATLRDPISKQNKESPTKLKEVGTSCHHRKGLVVESSKALRKIVGVLDSTVKRCEIYNPKAGIVHGEHGPDRHTRSRK